MKAIPTKYNGYIFRSRLEARWAVFFDEMNIEWIFEHEGYVLNDGTKYLPDFFFPRIGRRGSYGEVKPPGGDFSKGIAFAREAETDIWLCEGIPNQFPQKVYMGDHRIDMEELAVPIRLTDDDGQISHLFYQTGDECVENCVTPEYYAEIEQAVIASRRARFEFGQFPSSDLFGGKQ